MKFLNIQRKGDVLLFSLIAIIQITESTLFLYCFYIYFVEKLTDRDSIEELQNKELQTDEVKKLEYIID